MWKALGPLLLIVLPVIAEEVRIDPPVKVQVVTRAGERMAGAMVGYDAQGFTLRSAEGTEARVLWSNLEPRLVYQLHQRAFGKSPTARQWLDVGTRLLEAGDAQWSQTAFKNALRLDKSLAGEVEQAKAEASDALVAEKVWGRLNDEQSAAAVEKLKQFARDAQVKIGHAGLRSFETDFFLFVTDLDAAEAQKWNRLLDKMYAQLCAMFAIPEGVNIWHGKALVFTFKSREDFARYEATVENYEAAPGVAGLCHQHGPIVRIAFYRQPRELEFARILVHESSHGFLHRYRSPQRIVSWVNEGLAEWIAHDMVPVPGRSGAELRAEVREELRRRGDTGGMFDREHIDGWHYGVAYTLTSFMIDQNKRGYVKFINALKDGKEWRAALEEEYGAPLEKLVAAYGVSVGVGPIRP